MLIFEQSQPAASARRQMPASIDVPADLPARFAHHAVGGPARGAELQAVRHYMPICPRQRIVSTSITQSIRWLVHDEIQPARVHTLACCRIPCRRHPYAPESLSQGFLGCMWSCRKSWPTFTGMKGVSLAPMAGAQGGFAGVAMISLPAARRNERVEMLVPDAAHGTNPATAVQCGCTVREIPTDKNGDVDVEALKRARSKTAGIHADQSVDAGVFERRSSRSPSS